ncbi:MAG TPA: hypothetical protein VJQ47_00060 [Steroidobacteraceae bacterium]|nr:hypothetical protein [Steroidobacteraceae bacterium]
MWRTFRIAVLLLILLGVALHAWFDRAATTTWHNTLWIGIFPLNGDGSVTAQHYIDRLTQSDFADIEEFFQTEATRYGRHLAQPVHVELYPQPRQLPPPAPRAGSMLAVAWWSLELRWYAWRTSSVPGRAPPRVRMFVLYHDPGSLPIVPDSHGLQKGLMGVVHAFAEPDMTGSNHVVITHEVLHTLGATDKYDLGSGAPLFPTGFAEPERDPLYPQRRAEIMAGRRALSATEFETPRTLRDVVVGPATALEIHWLQP